MSIITQLSITHVCLGLIFLNKYLLKDLIEVGGNFHLLPKSGHYRTAKLNLLVGYMKLLYSSDTIQGPIQEFQNGGGERILRSKVCFDAPQQVPYVFVIFFAAK